MLCFNISTANVYSDASLVTFCTQIRRVSHTTYTALCDASFQAISLIKYKNFHHEQHDILEVGKNHTSDFDIIKSQILIIHSTSHALSINSIVDAILSISVYRSDCYVSLEDHHRNPIVCQRLFFTHLFLAYSLYVELSFYTISP